MALLVQNVSIGNAGPHPEIVGGGAIPDVAVRPDIMEVRAQRAENCWGSEVRGVLGEGFLRLCGGKIVAKIPAKAELNDGRAAGEARGCLSQKRRIVYLAVAPLPRL